MKKCIVLFLVWMFAMPLVGCAENAVLEESRIYQVESDIHSMEIRVGAADFVIVYADTFSVESNLKYLSVTEEDGVLKIIDKKTKGVTYDNPVLTLCVPTDVVFENVTISTGAAKLTTDALSAKWLKLQLGAGDVSISRLTALSGADIEGGAGRIDIAGGTINNLELEMGIGELNLTAALLGDNELTLGVGESNLTLIGNRDDYRLAFEKGIGSITVDGKTVADFGSTGNGHNRVQLEGGVGAINIRFYEAESL